MNTESKELGVLYHYCPANSFFGMIESKEIWLSNSTYTNDPEENQISLRILKDIIRDSENVKIKDLADKFHKHDIECRDFGFSPFIFCFSEMKDDLNQWRVYADYGKGYMIGFSKGYFLQNFCTHNLQQMIYAPFDKLFLAQCVYEREIQKKWINELLLDCLSEIEKEGENEEFLIQNYYNAFLIYSSMFKDKAYSVEKEWRLICIPIPQKQKHTVSYPLNFRNERGLLKQYIKIKLLENEKKQPGFPINHIKLGSNVRNRPDEVMKYIQYKLGDISFCRTIGKSKVLIYEK